MTEIVTATARKASARAFSFGAPEPVLDRRDIFGMLECVQNGQWYEPPMPMVSLARAFRVAPYHSSAILVKRNFLLNSFVPTRLLSRATFGRWVLDYLTMGNAYLELQRNVIGRPLTLAHSMAIYTRRGVRPGEFYYVTNSAVAHPFAPGSVHHLAEPDLTQEIYGVPEWLSGLSSSLLNEAATLFRRRYYLNGSHAGFILYATDENLSDDDFEGIEEQLGQAKGGGNFKNLMLHVPGGAADGIKLIPIGEAAAKDDFLNIKSTTRDDMLAAHRVPPILFGIIPINAGGLGDPDKASLSFQRNEIVPLQRRFLELNDWLGEEAVRFAPYDAGQPA